MIDINLLRKNPDFFKKTTRDKGFDDSFVDKLLVVDKRRRELLSDIESLRAKKINLQRKKEMKGEKLKLRLKIKN